MLTYRRPRKGRPQKVAARPRRRFPPEVLTDEEVGRLLRACSHRAGTGLRNRALIAVLYRAGLRINEALDLFPKDIDLASGSIRILCGKGGRPRTVGIDPAAGAIVECWLDARARASLNGRHPLFCTLSGARMGDAYIRVQLPRLGRRAGIEKRVHAHGLRHTHAAQLRVEGVDIGIISRQLGHRSIATTARYLDHIAPQQVIEAMRKRCWQRGNGQRTAHSAQLVPPAQIPARSPPSPNPRNARLSSKVAARPFPAQASMRRIVRSCRRQSPPAPARPAGRCAIRR